MVLVLWLLRTDDALDGVKISSSVLDMVCMSLWRVSTGGTAGDAGVLEDPKSGVVSTLMDRLANTKIYRCVN
jgi:hypothetical protein